MIDKLSHREREVAELIAQGLSNKLIADELGISPHTAKFHVYNVIQKLGGGTRVDAAVAWAVAKAFEKGFEEAKRLHECPKCRVAKSLVAA